MEVNDTLPTGLSIPLKQVRAVLSRIKSPIVLRFVLAQLTKDYCFYCMISEKSKKCKTCTLDEMTPVQRFHYLNGSQKSVTHRCAP